MPINTTPTITITPEYGGAYAWLLPPGSPPWNGVGGNIASIGCWGWDQPISQELEEAFSAWQEEFEAYACVETDSPAGSSYSRFNWPWFHDRGIDLAIRLKAELGESAIVVYEKSYEDPGRNIAERTEILAGGKLKPLPSRKQLAILERESAK